MELWMEMGEGVSLNKFNRTFLLRKKYPYSKIFWSVFSSIQTEYKEIRSISRCIVYRSSERLKYSSKFIESDKH